MQIFGAFHLQVQKQFTFEFVCIVSFIRILHEVGYV